MRISIVSSLLVLALCVSPLTYSREPATFSRKHEVHPVNIGYVHEGNCSGLELGFRTETYGEDKWSCKHPIRNVGHEQWKSLQNLRRFERYLTLGTYENQNFYFDGPGRFPLPPQSRFHTLSYAFADFESRNGKVIVEVGTSRSFQHGGGPGCNLDDPKWWHPSNPEDWDWGAGHFTHLACTSLARLLQRGRMFTVDLLAPHIARSRLMTRECSNYVTYKVQSSLDFFTEYDIAKYGKIDLLYLDTGDMTPVEVTAELHLEEARIIVQRELVQPGGLILIDDVRNLAPKQFGEAPGDTYGKAKYSIEYLLAHGFSMVKSEYQVVLRNSADPAIIEYHSRVTPSTKTFRLFHVSYHLGCINEIKYVAKELGFELDSLLWDGAGDGNEKYNVNHARAQKYWNLLKKRALEADLVIVSDTAPLARIFLQNKYPGKLIIWICNRFDYAHDSGHGGISKEDKEKFAGEHPLDFPTPEYYNLIRQAALSPRVAVVSYTEFEHIYAREHRSVDVGKGVIKPSGYSFTLGDGHIEIDGRGRVPPTVNKPHTFLIPPYHNDGRTLMKCKLYNIECYAGRYAGPLDARDFKGIIHIPYAWSNLALFEMLSQGVPYIIPTKSLLLQERDIFWSPPYDVKHLDAAEWYNPQHASLFTYFDSWEELPLVINETDFDAKRQSLKAFSEKHRRHALKQWQTVFFRL